jgi:threonine/homoserine/homoserine lactone efflux protein
MLLFILRTIILVGLVGLLVQQAQRAPSGSHKRRAFLGGAGAVWLFLIVIFLQVFALDFAAVLPFLFLAELCLFGSLGLLFLAWQKGEMQEQISQIKQAIARERFKQEQSNEMQLNEKDKTNDH